VSPTVRVEVYWARLGAGASRSETLAWVQTHLEPFRS
jgi:hypothetical protein